MEKVLGEKLDQLEKIELETEMILNKRLRLAIENNNTLTDTFATKVYGFKSKNKVDLVKVEDVK